MTPRRASSIVALAATGLLLAGCAGGGSGDGPLSGLDLSLGQPVEVGKDFSLGIVMLFLDSGDDPAQIERVRLVGVKGSMEMLGVPHVGKSVPRCRGSGVGPRRAAAGVGLSRLRAKRGPLPRRCHHSVP